MTGSPPIRTLARTLLAHWLNPHYAKMASHVVGLLVQQHIRTAKAKLTLKVLVATVDALGHFETG